MNLAFLSNLKPRERMMLLAAAIVLFACLVKFSVVQPVLKHIDWLDGPDGQIRLLKEQVRRYDALIARKQHIEDSYQRSHGLVMQAASDAEAQRKIQGEVDALLAGLGITEYQSLDAQGPVDRVYYQEFPVRVADFEADISRLLTLLDRLVEMRRQKGMMKVTKLGFTVAPGNTGLLKGTMTVSQIASPTGGGGEDEPPVTEE